MEVGLVTAAVDPAKEAQGRGYLDPEDWPLYPRTNCLGRAQWQEGRVDSHLHGAVDH